MSLRPILASPSPLLSVRSLTAAALTVATFVGCARHAAPRPAAPAGPRGCLAIGYYQGADIDLDSRDPYGAWRVQVTGAGETMTVEMTVTPAANGVPHVTCAGAASPRDLGCGVRGQRIDVVVSPAMGDGLTRARVANVDALGGPAEIGLRVDHAGRTVAPTLRPAYRSDEPGGPGCGLRIASSDRVAID